MRSRKKWKRFMIEKGYITPLGIGDFVYVLNPRWKNIKLQASYEGPLENENVYTIQMRCANKASLEWLPLDWLCRCYRRNVSSSFESTDNAPSLPCENTGGELISAILSGTSEDDDDEHQVGVPDRYNLRPQPAQAVQRLQVSYLKLIWHFFRGGRCCCV